VLAVVEHQEQAPFSQVAGEGRQRPDGRLVTKIQRVQGGVDEQRGIVERNQLDQADAARESSRQLGSRALGQARLAAAAGAGQRQQPGALEEAFDLGQLAAAPDEAGHLSRQPGGWVLPARVATQPQH
jgi:hypothetical protein